MSRTQARPPAGKLIRLDTCQDHCWHCGSPLWVAYHSRRKLVTLDGLIELLLAIRRCNNEACPLFHRPYRPELETHYALPHGEFGLDVIARVGALRFSEHRSVPEIHQTLSATGVSIAERSVTEQLYRYEELVAVRVVDNERLCSQLSQQGGVVLAIDGLQPDVGHEILWVLRDCLSGEALLARSLLGGGEDELVPLLLEVKDALQALPAPVPIIGVISDGQRSIRNAVATALPGVPHQLCQFHYLREAARPIYEADRHAKKELKKHVRGVRSIERALEEREKSHDIDEVQAQAIRGYALAVRSALTDDGRPPLCASGLKLHQRLEAIVCSIDRVTATAKGGHYRRN